MNREEADAARQDREGDGPAGNPEPMGEGDAGPSPDVVASTIEALQTRVEDRDALRGTLDPRAPLAGAPGEGEPD